MKKLKDLAINFEFENKEDYILDNKEVIDDLLNNDTSNNELSYDYESLSLQNGQLNFDITNYDNLDFFYKNKFILATDKQNNIIIFLEKTNDDIKKWLVKNNISSYIINFTKEEKITKFLKNYFINDNLDFAANSVNRVRPSLSAANISPQKLIRCFSSFFYTIILLSIISKNNFIYFLIATHLSYLTVNLFKLYLFIKSLSIKDNDIYIEDKENDLPIYTILVPLYKEKDILGHLFSNLDKISYPIDKLDIKIILESNDHETIEAVNNFDLQNCYDVIIVPDGAPKTKSRACNYALKFVKGELVTIYDAEDRPDPYQLKKVLTKFYENPELVCVQAKLNYYNREENILTKYFSIEYKYWFDYMLKSLEELKMTIPLGGTSNHVRVDVLKKILAWDAYNVTEDADLGFRIALLCGHRTAIINSTTLEESPIKLSQWIKQRTRWLKGFIQTYIVYSMRNNKFLQKSGLKSWMGLQLFIGLPTFIFLLTPCLIIMSYMFQNDNIIVKNLLLFNFIFSSLMYIVTSFIICNRSNWQKMSLAIITFPLYWILHTFAALRAFWQLVYNPFYWEKTTHGISKYN